jgi:TolB-like protein
MSAGLRKILGKCLKKLPEERYQTAADLRADLEGLAARVALAPMSSRAVAGAWSHRRIAVTGGLLVLGIVALAALWRGGWLRGVSAGGRIDSLAVLPLSNLSKDPAQEYFADGMTEALIAELSRIRALKVISRTSVMQYKNAMKPLPEIARALGVKGVVEGSVMREGDSVRISVQLIEADSDRHLWAESYTRDLKNILALQSEVASAIAREVRVAVTPEEAQRLAAARPVDPEAHREVLLGNYAITQSLTQRAGIEKGIEHFRKAIEIDPKFAVAHTRLADGLQWEAFGGLRPTAGPCAEAKAEAEKALELDPQQADAFAVLGGLRQSCDFDWTGAERDYRRALELAPGSAVARYNYANFLGAVGRHDEAIAMYLSRKVSRPETNFALGLAYGLAGRKAEARKVLESLLEKRKSQFVPPTCIAIVYAGLGEMDAAFEWLDHAYEERAFLVDSAKTDPLFDVFRSDPRFEAFLRKMNYPK